jgi:hypothetical protein
MVWLGLMLVVEVFGGLGGHRREGVLHAGWFTSATSWAASRNQALG